MNLDKVAKLLKKYNIKDIEELEYYLNVDSKSNECIDDPVENKNCINAKCYEDIFVPDCRKIVEIYNKYFKNDFKSKKLFIEYLIEHTNKSESSIKNYLSCKSCNQQMEKSINNSLKISDSDFKKDFCFNLEIKLNYMTLFERNYISINQFLAKEHRVTKESFKSTSNSDDTNLTKEEKEKLFEIIYVSKKVLKLNLSNPKNIEGSQNYKMNLALAAFNRNLVEESSQILTLLSTQKEFNADTKFLQLKAKILSNQKNDKEAIVILNKLVEMFKPNIDTETNNLLSASIKRDAFKEFKLYSDEVKLREKLSIAKEMYFSIYKLNHHYYPALNYMYLESIIAYIDNKDTTYIQVLKNQYSTIWSNIEYRITDWWSYIANVEYLILVGKYKEASHTLKEHFSTIDTFEISDFNIFSTIRQLKLYSEFCTDNELLSIITLLEDYESNANIESAKKY